MPRLKTEGLNPEQIDLLLEQHKIKKTEIRRAIVTYLSQSSAPKSQAEILLQLERTMDSVDRVSVYRNLQTLRKAELIHEIHANAYIFCFHPCSEHAHVLLLCQTCHNHSEVKDHQLIRDLSQNKIISGFFDKTSPLFIRGTCKNCALRL